MARNATNKLLHQAKSSRNDEFYTLMEDIERELKYYTDKFRGKVVYCNCDDSRISNFYKYFKNNFESLGLKALISSSFCPRNNDLFCMDEAVEGSYTIYEGRGHEERHLRLNGNGDFRSSECVRLLDQSDIVVTNPPFSLFREFVSLMIRKDKKFLIIGNINAITYKEIFSLIQKNRVWLGVHMGRGISGFKVPDSYELYGTEARVNEYGDRIISPNNCLWLTNIDVSTRHDLIKLTKTYEGNVSFYPEYDNYNGINVDRTSDIPMDYDGVIGVPITFLHKYNPEQFEITRFRKGYDGKDLSINGKCPYFRILVRNRFAQKVSVANNNY